MTQPNIFDDFGGLLPQREPLYFGMWYLWLGAVSGRVVGWQYNGAQRAALGLVDRQEVEDDAVGPLVRIGPRMPHGLTATPEDAWAIALHHANLSRPVMDSERAVWQREYDELQNRTGWTRGYWS